MTREATQQTKRAWGEITKIDAYREFTQKQWAAAAVGSRGDQNTRARMGMLRVIMGQEMLVAVDVQWPWIIERMLKCWATGYQPSGLYH